ncbi:MAG: R3H domain-containing nucleic acid-binding protein, partial [Bdellovibrionia bacterium]
VLELADLNLTFEIVSSTDEQVTIEVAGEDEDLLRDKDGQLLDALQFYMKRVIQHQLPESKVEVVFDSRGYREESNQALVDLAEKLKQVAIEKNRSVYFRALSPKDRKIIHQYLATDERVKSRSIGEGLYKKIKIFPAGQADEKRGGRGGGGGGGRRGRQETAET